MSIAAGSTVVKRGELTVAGLFGILLITGAGAPASGEVSVTAAAADSAAIDSVATAPSPARLPTLLDSLSVETALPAA